VRPDGERAPAPIDLPRKLWPVFLITRRRPALRAKLTASCTCASAVSSEMVRNTKTDVTPRLVDKLDSARQEASPGLKRSQQNEQKRQEDEKPAAMDADHVDSSRSCADLRVLLPKNSISMLRRAGGVIVKTGQKHLKYIAQTDAAQENAGCHIVHSS
jgi:hypothetical protein